MYCLGNKEPIVVGNCNAKLNLFLRHTFFVGERHLYVNNLPTVITG